jgi:hypothetical protein
MFYLNPITFEAFRIIIVPIPESNIIAKSAPAVDFTNYAEVAKYYGLE